MHAKAHTTHMRVDPYHDHNQSRSPYTHSHRNKRTIILLMVLLSLVIYLDRFSFHALVASICLFGPFAWSCAHLGRAFSGELLHGLTPIPPHTIYEVFTCRSPNYPPSLPTFFPSTKTIILRHTSTILLPLLILNDENSPTTDHEHVSQTVFKLFPNTSSNMHFQWLDCIQQREFSRI